MINGTWDSKLEGSPVIAETVVKGKSSLEIGPTKTLWKVSFALKNENVKRKQQSQINVTFS